jgi:putative ABC transport system substrate-binding protein
MRRREFIGLVGGATIWPIVARAQQLAMPVIGFLNIASPDTFVDRLRGFRQGLREAGFVETENVTIIYRWAENEGGRLPQLAAELVRRKVTVIVATGGAAPALAAKATGTTIPIVFGVPNDPVNLGLVASLAQPGGNLTGINFFSNELVAKRLNVLRELLPGAVRLAVLFNPTGADAESIARDLEAARRAMGLEIHILNASTKIEIDAAFAALATDRPDALFVAPDPLFFGRRVQLALLAARHGLPTTFSVRDNVEAGGLMSYGSDITDAYRQVGVYAGRIIKGEKPADLPVVQSSKFELVINLQTAKILGLTVPPMLLARADAVIE